MPAPVDAVDRKGQKYPGAHKPVTALSCDPWQNDPAGHAISAERPVALQNEPAEHDWPTETNAAQYMPIGQGVGAELMLAQ